MNCRAEVLRLLLRGAFYLVIEFESWAVCVGASSICKSAGDGLGIETVRSRPEASRIVAVMLEVETSDAEDAEMADPLLLAS